MVFGEDKRNYQTEFNQNFINFGVLQNNVNIDKSKYFKDNLKSCFEGKFGGVSEYKYAFQKRKNEKMQKIKK